MPFNFTVIQSGISYLDKAEGKTKQVQVCPAVSFNLQASQMDLRGPTKG